MRKLSSLLVFAVTLVSLLAVPLSGYAAIQWADGEDDCDHEYEVISYDSESSEVTLLCSLCGYKTIEKCDDYLSSNAVMTLDVNSDTCSHNYQIVAFDRNTAAAVVVCSYCGDKFEDDFAVHVYDGTTNTNYVKWFDAVEDGYINGKDFAALYAKYSDESETAADIKSGLSSFLSQSSFSYKEIFFYGYFTVLIVLLFVISIIIKRKLV